MTQVLGERIWEAPDDVEILRCKGLFHGFGTASDAVQGQYMLQGVGDVFELRPMGGATHEGAAKFLFVGRGIDIEALKQDLSSCIREQQAAAD